MKPPISGARIEPGPFSVLQSVAQESNLARFLSEPGPFSVVFSVGPFSVGPFSVAFSVASEPP